MDLAALYAAYRHDGHGRAAYEPAVMVALLLYCWRAGRGPSDRAGVCGARRVPRDRCPAAARSRHDRSLCRSPRTRVGRAVRRVLVLCADAGLASVGVIAVDGTKVAANANRDRTMDYEQLAKTIVQEQITTDTADDALHGQGRGDEKISTAVAPMPRHEAAVGVMTTVGCVR
jgi:hypothetical protein